MENFVSLCQRYTRLSAVQREMLRRTAALLPFLADLAHARARLYLIAEAEHAFVLGAQASPHTVYLSPDGVEAGTVVARQEEPLLARALRTRGLVRGKREVRYGSMGGMLALPLVIGGAALAAISFEMTEETAGTEGYARLFRAVELLLKNPRQERNLAQFAPLSASDGIIITDGSSRITFATTAALRIFRVLGVGSLVGGHLFDQQVIQHIEKETQDMRRPWEREIEAGGLTLRERSIEVREGGCLLCRIVILSDLTEVRERDRAIKVQSAVIQEIHHRVKNNLQTIASLLRLQARRSKSPEVKAALSESVNRILSIAVVHEFLSEQGHATIDVQKIAQQIFDLVAMSMVGRDFTLHTECQGDPLVLPSSCASSLGLILNELVLNAAEHGFAGRQSGQMCLTTTEAAGRARLVFEDDGVGLPAGFRPEKQRSLGVSIMRTLTEGDLGGTLRFAARPGGGTRVTIEIPVKKEEEA